MDFRNNPRVFRAWRVEHLKDARKTVLNYKERAGRKRTIRENAPKRHS